MKRIKDNYGKIPVILVAVSSLFLIGCEEEVKEEVTSEKTAFVVIHMEPGETPKSTDYAEEHWPNLVGLVGTADKYNIKLTLEFNPQWAEYILDNSAALSLLREWEGSGHEIGIHHHPTEKRSGAPSWLPITWSGYTDHFELLSPEERANYLGTMEDAVSLVSQLSTSGRIVTGGMPDENEWPSGIIYRTEGNQLADLTSRPTARIVNGNEITELRHSTYATGGNSLKLEEVESYYYKIAPGSVMGICFHAFNYEESPSEIEELFASLNQNEITVRTVKEIISSTQQLWTPHQFL